MELSKRPVTPQLQQHGKPPAPFYSKSSNKKTSAEIVSEARSSIRTLEAKRPFTPLDERRSLYSHRPLDQNNTLKDSSSLLQRRSSLPTDYRPISSKTRKLKPLVKTPSAQLLLEKESHFEKLASNQAITSGLPRVPSLAGALRDSKETHSLTEISVTPRPPNTTRRVHSGPKERTQKFFQKRTEADGKECDARRPSANSGKIKVEIQRLPLRSQRNKEDSTTFQVNSYCQYITPSTSSSEHSITSIPSNDQKSQSLTIRDSIRDERQYLESRSERECLGSRSSRDKPETLYFKRNVEPILVQLDSKLTSEDAKRLIDLLHSTLLEGGMLNKSCRYRAIILRSLYRLLDINNSSLLLNASRIILTLRVSGKNLVNIAKLIYKVSKSDANDSYFLENNFIDVLLSAIEWVDATISCEALIYLAAAVRFLSGNSLLVEEIFKHDGVTVLAAKVAKVNASGITTSDVAQAMIQITAALRNMADSMQYRHLFISNSVLPQLCILLQAYSTDPDLVLNVSRLFSKLTLYTDCCENIAECLIVYPVMLNLLNKHIQNQDIIVRLTFTLGNLLAKSEHARIQLFLQPSVMQSVVSLIKVYRAMSIKVREDDSIFEGNEMATAKVDDILIKVVRVIANLAIHHENGVAMATDDSLCEVLLDVLDSEFIDDCEELMLNTVAALNNLSFYQVDGSAINKAQMKICKLLLKILLADQNTMEATVEVLRVFGNLTQHNLVRQFIVQHKVDKLLVTLLDSSNRDVVFITCGVLINLLSDCDKREHFGSGDGVRKLIDVLKDFGSDDWQLAGLVCQTLWNYSDGLYSTVDTFTAEENAELVEVLTYYLGYEQLAVEKAAQEVNHDDDDDNINEAVLNMWREDFYPVASRLITRLEGCINQFEELDEEPERL